MRSCYDIFACKLLHTYLLCCIAAAAVCSGLFFFSDLVSQIIMTFVAHFLSKDCNQLYVRGKQKCQYSEED